MKKKNSMQQLKENIDMPTYQILQILYIFVLRCITCSVQRFSARCTGQACLVHSYEPVTADIPAEPFPMLIKSQKHIETNETILKARYRLSRVIPTHMKMATVISSFLPFLDSYSSGSTRLSTWLSTALTQLLF